MPPPGFCFTLSELTPKWSRLQEFELLVLYQYTVSTLHSPSALLSCCRPALSCPPRFELNCESLKMAFVFSSLSSPGHVPLRVEYIHYEACRYLRLLTQSHSIVLVPAIGADPRKTWARSTDTDGLEHHRLDYV